MKKSRVILVAIFSFALIFSFCILLFSFGYDKNICDLIKEVLLSIFTGCVFVLPSGLIVLYYEYQRLMSKKRELLSKLSKLINRLDIDSSSIFNDRFEIYELHIQVEKLKNNYLFKSNDEWKELSDALFRLHRQICVYYDSFIIDSNSQNSKANKKELQLCIMSCEKIIDCIYEEKLK